MSGNLLQSPPEVDFSVPHKVQIAYNEHIYDTAIAFKNSRLEINFINEKELLGGAFVSLDKEAYKITYKNMVFEGSASDLNQSFLPCLIYALLDSFNGPIVFDCFDEVRECYYVKKNIQGYFVTLECYKTENVESFSIEIK